MHHDRTAAFAGEGEGGAEGVLLPAKRALGRSGLLREVKAIESDLAQRHGLYP